MKPSCDRCPQPARYLLFYPSLPVGVEPAFCPRHWARWGRRLPNGLLIDLTLSAGLTEAADAHQAAFSD